MNFPYPKSYHKACNHLVSFGSHGGNTTQGRNICAQALREVRKIFGSEFARQARYGMIFISGQFPVKH
jgi:hypothetical protein